MTDDKLTKVLEHFDKNPEAEKTVLKTADKVAVNISRGIAIGLVIGIAALIVFFGIPWLEKQTAKESFQMEMKNENP